MISEAAISRQCLRLFLSFSEQIEIENNQKVATERHCILEYENKREKRWRVCRIRELKGKKEREFVEIMS